MRARLSFLKTIRFLVAMLFLSASLASIQSCRVEESSADSGEGSGDSADDGSEDLALTSFKVYAESEDASYSLYATKDGDGETPCIPTEDDKDITCVIDMEELDLMHRGLTIKIDLPGEGSENDFQCAYLYEHPYYYRVFPVNIYTPDEVYIVEDDGALADPTATYGVGGTADIYYTIGGVTYAHADLYGEAATGPDEMRCPWDYSDVGTLYEGKNCCVGLYTEYKATLATGEPPELNTSTNEWGGDYSSCLSGSGVIDWEPRNSYGLPEFKITNVPMGGLQTEYNVSAAANGDDIWERQIFGANYFSGEMPSPLADGNPYYIYGCLNHNFEYLYRIRVQVREWNKAGELAKLIEGAAADPDSSGCESTPFGMMPINDYSDWGDYQDAVNPGYLLTTYGFSLDAGAGSDILTVLNLDGSSYTETSQFLDHRIDGWGIDSCP